MTKKKKKSNKKKENKDKQTNEKKSPSDINLFDNRIIRLNGDINTEEGDKIVEQLLKLDATKSKKDIIFYINSPGGLVSAGLAIYDTMQMVKSNIKTVCLGRCSSMAAILLSGGTKGKRYITPNSEVMIHEMSSYSGGKIGEIKISYEHSNTLNERLMKILADNTGKSIKQVKKDVELKDKWFNAEEALKYGIVDKILTSTEN